MKKDKLNKAENEIPKEQKPTGGKRIWLIAAVVGALLLGGAAGALLTGFFGEDKTRSSDNEQPQESVRVQQDGFTFEQDEFGRYYVVEYDGRDEDVVIPDNVNGVPISGIREGAFYFYECEDMRSLVIPEGVYAISDGAFHDCRELVSVEIPETLTKIGDRAFMNCISLRSITLPEGMTTIGTEAFWGCDSLEEIVVPEQIQAIGSNAFGGCDSLVTATINPSVYLDQVDLGWFYDCNSLRTLNFSCYFSDITWGYSVLPELQEINVLDSSGEAMGPNVTYVYGSVDGVLYTRDEIVYCPRGRTGALTLPDWVSNIGSNAFGYGCRLTEINIPADIIGFTADDFSGCTGLEAVNIAEDNPVYRSVDGVVYTKDGSTLLYCPRGKQGELIIPEGTARIGTEAFCRCTLLTEVTIPESVTHIGHSAFYMTEEIIVNAPHYPDYYDYYLDTYVSWHSNEGFNG